MKTVLILENILNKIKTEIMNKTSSAESNLGRKIDNLISVSQGSNPNIALSSLISKVDNLKQDVGTKSSQTTVNKVGQDLNNIASTITSKIGTVETKVNQTNTTLESMDNSIDIIVVKATESRDYAQGIHNIVSKGVIKRVQRGELYSDDIHKLFRVKSKPKGSIGSIVSECVVNLPYAVNVSKSIILCNFVSTGLGSGAQTPNVGCALNNATINLYMANYNYFFANDQYYIINWQVIEFY